MPKAEPSRWRDDDRFVAAMAAIDAVRADDPVSVVVDGETRSKELLHAERMTHWLGVLDPDAGPLQHLAARAAHLRRWRSPRTSYPEGRKGYLRWRADQKRRQAQEIQVMLADAGYPDAASERVGAIVAKKDRTTDPTVQVHEDALCLSFLELEFDDLAERLGDDQTVDVLRRTATKMSPAALDLAGSLDLGPRGGALLARAMDPA